MAYKGDTWFKIRGKKTHLRFFIHGAFEDAGEHMRLWEKEIGYKLDSPAMWTASISSLKTQISRYNIYYETTRKYPPGLLTFEIGLYRDGFHINMQTLHDRSHSAYSGHMNDSARIELSKGIFGDPNETEVWTQEIAKVAPMANELLNRIDEYYKK